MELIKIIKYLDKKFNEKIAAKWDNVGIQQYDEKKLVDLNVNIENVLISLDINQEVIEMAIKSQVNLIISRHPFLFDDLQNDRKNKKELIKLLEQNKILIYSIHTNYDASANQNLLKLLNEVFKISKVKRLGLDNEGYEVKLKTEISPKEFIQNFKKIFNTGISQINSKFNFKSKIKDFLIITGSGGDILINNKITNSYFVTGEIKWNQLIYANDHKVSTLVLGHYMEKYFIDHLQQMLEQNFTALKVEKIDLGNQLVNY